MRDRSPDRDAAAMRIPSRHTLTLELEVDADDDVTGRLVDADGHGADFVGWLGLASAIERLSAPPDTRPPSASPVRSLNPTPEG